MEGRWQETPQTMKISLRPSRFCRAGRVWFCQRQGFKHCRFLLLPSELANCPFTLSNSNKCRSPWLPCHATRPLDETEIPERDSRGKQREKPPWIVGGATGRGLPSRALTPKCTSESKADHRKQTAASHKKPSKVSFLSFSFLCFVF